MPRIGSRRIRKHAMGFRRLVVNVGKRCQTIMYLSCSRGFEERMYSKATETSMTARIFIAATRWVENAPTNDVALHLSIDTSYDEPTSPKTFERKTVEAYVIVGPVSLVFGYKCLLTCLSSVHFPQKSCDCRGSPVFGVFGVANYLRIEFTCTVRFLLFAGTDFRNLMWP
jgi:hypothetical protein